MTDTKIEFEDAGKFRQYLAAITVNLITISYGALCGWPSPVIPQLRSEHSPVGDSPMSEENTSWIGGLLCIGGLIGSLFSGSLADRIGRKYFGYATSIPIATSLLMTIFANNHGTLYISRFIAGIGGGMATFISPCYASEIASEKVRGALGSLFMLSYTSGVLIAFVAGAFLSYTNFGVFLLAFPLLFLVAFFFMPETPVFLVQRNQLVEANKSLMFFKDNNTYLATEELSRMQIQIRSARNLERKPGFFNLFKDPATRRGMLIASGLISGQQLGGIFAMVSYAETIFQLSGSPLSPETAAIIIGVIQVLGCYLSTMLMERAGRRPLILISSLGMCICLVIVGSFFYFHTSGYDLSTISFVPVVALSLYMITYCLGMGPVPFVIASEVFHIDVASLANTFCILFLWIVSFIVIEIFSPMMVMIGMHGCFFVFGFFCAGTFIFSLYLVPETKGRRREEIIEELAGIVKIESSIIEKTDFSSKDAQTKELIASESV